MIQVGKPILVRYLLLGLVAVSIVYLGAGFAQQSRVRQQRLEELQRVEQEIALAQQETAALEKHQAYVHSPAAVEAWARENGWARPNEVPVVLVGPPGELPLAQDRLPGQSPPPESVREVWWQLFFGHR